MVREHTVRLKKLAAGNIRAKPCQHLSGIKSAGAVSGVHNYFIPFKRLFLFGFTNRIAYQLSEPRSVQSHIVGRDNLAFPVIHHSFAVISECGYFGNVRRVKSALGCKKFKAVAVKRVVAGGYLHGGVSLQINRCHKHRRR